MSFNPSFQGDFNGQQNQFMNYSHNVDARQIANSGSPQQHQMIPQMGQGGSGAGAGAGAGNAGFTSTQQFTPDQFQRAHLQNQQFQQQQQQQQQQPMMGGQNAHFGYNNRFQAAQFKPQKPGVTTPGTVPGTPGMPTNVGNMQQQLKYVKGPMDASRAAAIQQAAVYQRIQQQQQQQQQQPQPLPLQQQQQQQQQQPVTAQHQPMKPQSTAGGPGAASLPPVNQLSSPEEIVKVINKLPSPQTPEEHDLVAVIKKDAQQGIILKKSEREVTEQNLKTGFKMDFYAQLQLLRQYNPAIVFQEGYRGYGNGWAGSKTTLIYPRNRRRFGRNTRDLWLSEDQIQWTARVPETLVPIRIDFDEDKFRLRDTFTWNLNEKVITVNQFAETLLDDFGIPTHLASHIVASMNEQIQDFQPHTFNTSTTPTPGFHYDDDMRIVVKLDITIGQHNLVDQFEWDINCVDNNPEEFAEQMARDMALPGEFSTAIAHAIREQSELYTKSLVMTGHPFDGRLVEDDDVRSILRPSITPEEGEGVLRPKHSLREYSPVLFEIPDGELDRQDKDRDRDSRRKRRQGRAGRRAGPTVPDFREHIRTFRTPVYSAILPGGVDRNIEVLRRQIQKVEDSDDEDNDSMTNSRSRRGRTTHSSSHQSSIYRNSPGRTSGLSGQPVRKRPRFDRPSNTRYLFQPPQIQNYEDESSPEPVQRFVVTLKVPRLGQFLRASNRI